MANDGSSLSSVMMKTGTAIENVEENNHVHTQSHFYTWIFEMTKDKNIHVSSIHSIHFNHNT